MAIQDAKVAKKNDITALCPAFLLRWLLRCLKKHILVLSGGLGCHLEHEPSAIGKGCMRQYRALERSAVESGGADVFIMRGIVFCNYLEVLSAGQMNDSTVEEGRAD